MEQTSISNLNTKTVVNDNDYLVIDDLSSTNKILAKTILDTCKQELLNKLYPIGSIYMSVNSTSPSTLFGGTWEQIKDTFLLGSGSYTLGATGGEKTHTLSESELPAITGSLQLHGQESGSGIYNIYGHITGTKKENMYRTPTASTGTYSYVSVGFAFGGSQAHNNMPPYLVVNIWKRTA